MSVNRTKRDRSAAVRDGVMRHIVGEARADTRRTAKAAAIADKALEAKPAEPAQPRGAMKIRDEALNAARRLTRAAPTKELKKPTEFTVYQPLKGVIPEEKKKLAMDEALAITSSFNILAQWGGIDGAFSEGLGFLGYSYLAELTQRPEYRRMSERIATEMTREWIELQVTSADTVEGTDNGPDEDEESEQEPSAPGVPAKEDAEDQDGSTPQDVRVSVEKAASNAKTKMLKELEDELNRLNVKDAFYNAAEQDGWFGRSHLFLEIGGEMAISDDEEQATSIGNGNDVISLSKVGNVGGKEGSAATPAAPKRGRKPAVIAPASTDSVQGKLTAVRNIEPMWCYPSSYESVDPRKPGFYNPSHWYVNGRNTHATRLLTFVGRKLPDILKPAYAFGGLALSQMAKPYVDNWLRTRQAVADLIESFSVSGVYTNMSGILEDGGIEALKRIELFNITRSNAGAYMLDKETEEFFNVSTPLGTLDDLQAQSQEQMSSVSGIPLVILLGITPKGLNASSEGEIRAFYDWIHAYQESLFRDHLQTVIEFVQLSLWGKIDPEITFIFKPLWSMTAKEEAEVDKTEAEADQVRIDSGVLHPEEVRKAVAAKPGSRYADINVEDVPEPPADPNEGGDDPFGNGGGDDDGSDEGGDADGGFAQDEAVMLAALMGNDEWTEGDHPRATDGKFGSGSGGSSKSSGSKAAASSSKGSAGASSSPLNMKHLRQVEGKLGSNEGGRYVNEEGGEFYIKKPKTKEHVANELAAAKLYQLAGVNTLKYRDVEGGGHVATEWQQLDKNNISKFTPEEKKAAAADFAIHAWLSNWDAAGLGGDNQGIQGGKPTTLDVGGSLRFRAQGGPKGAAFGDKVTELDTLRDKSMNPDAAGLFGKMTDDAIKSSIERVTSIPDDKIRAAVGDDAALADRLIARKQDMAKRFGVIAQDELEDRDAAMMFMALDAAVDASIEEIAEDVFTVDAIALDEFNESKIKRDKDGKFSETGGGGGGKENEEAKASEAPAFKTKKDHIAHLLSGGVTPKELMTAMGWPSVSMPAQAKSLGMKLEKKDGKYFGTKMTAEELAAAKEADQDKATQKAMAKTASPETLPGSSAGQAKKPEAIEIPKGPEPSQPPQNYSQFLGAIAEAAQKKDVATIEGLMKYNPNWAKQFGSTATPAGKAALEKVLPGVFDYHNAPQATPEEKKKAAKSTSLPMNAQSPGGAQVIKDFNEKYAGKDGLTDEQLNQKVQDHKDMTKAVKQIDAEYAAKSQAEKIAAEKKASEELQAKAAKKAAADKAALQAQFDADPELKVHYEAMEALFGGKSTGEQYASQVAKKVKASGLPITPAAAMPIVAYSGSHYAKLNSDIRSGVMDVAQYKFLKSLNAGLDNLPAYDGVTYRKAPSGAVDLSMYQPGKVVEERGFTSTSKNKGTWHGDVQYTVHGKTGRDIQKLSSHPGEAEVLFKSGTRFLVEKIDKSGGGHHITLREI